jgi:hypothetical protein
MSNLALIRVPKCGSTTLAHSLRPLFKSDDYPCLAPTHNTVGLFLSHDHPHDFVSMVRDPLQLYCSAYYYVRNVAAQGGFYDNLVQGLRKVVLEEHTKIALDTTLEEYLVSAPENDFMTVFFEGIEPKDFLFLGEVNQMQTSLDLFTRITGIPTNYEWANKNPNRPETLQPYWADPSVVSVFKKRNEQEYEVYAKSIEHFNHLKSTWL